MLALKNSMSFQSYAFNLRKKLISGVSPERLLDQHQRHQTFIDSVLPTLDLERLSYSDRFAWKFIREVNILDSKYSAPTTREHLPSEGHIRKRSTCDPRTKGVYQNLPEIVDNVQDIWFPDIKKRPKAVWLKHYSTRKLAHYSFGDDEIAFSLIFDTLDAPPEIMSYLAYHELLHRFIGSRKVNGRRYTHTREFKEREHLFPNWLQMDDQIRNYITTTR